MHPFVLNAFRFVASMGSILLVYAIQKEPFLKWDAIKLNLRMIVLVGFLGYFVYQVVFILGIKETTAGNSAIIMASSPVWTALTAMSFYNERLSKLAWTGLLLSILGAIFVSVTGGKQISFSIEFLAGNILILIASVCWGAYTTFSKPATRFIDPKGLTLLGLLISFPFNVLIAIPHLGDVVWSDVSLLTWIAIMYSGGLSTGLAVVAWTFSVKQVGATHTAVFGNLVPVVAIIASFFILGEDILLAQLLGGSLIVGGLILMRLNR